MSGVDIKIGLKDNRDFVLAFVEQNDGHSIEQENIAAVSRQWMRGDPKKEAEREALFVDFAIKVVVGLGADQGAELGEMIPLSEDGTIVGGRA